MIPIVDKGGSLNLKKLEEIRLYCESRMDKDWDRKDAEMVGVFYNYYIEKLIQELRPANVIESRKLFELVKLSDEKPSYDALCAVSFNGVDIEQMAVFKETTQCMASGNGAGYFHDKFEDEYNHLVLSDVTHWLKPIQSSLTPKSIRDSEAELLEEIRQIKAVIIHFATLDKMPTLELLDRERLIEHVVTRAQKILKDYPVKSASLKPNKLSDSETGVCKKCDNVVPVSGNDIQL